VISSREKNIFDNIQKIILGGNTTKAYWYKIMFTSIYHWNGIKNSAELVGFAKGNLQE
jgi:hypothetical protein